jgi:hypothetical protein
LLPFQLAGTAIVDVHAKLSRAKSLRSDVHRAIELAGGKKQEVGSGSRAQKLPKSISRVGDINKQG